MDDTKQKVIQQLGEIYFKTRPHLDVSHDPAAILFFACSGAGKSTVRRYLVDNAKATYVCNDEVRQLIQEHPETQEHDIQIKEIVYETIRLIQATAKNKCVIYDNIIVKYYMHDDSYFNNANSNHWPVFVIGLSVPEEELRRRITERGINLDEILGNLPEQLRAYDAAVQDITPDFVITDTHDTTGLEQLKESLAAKIKI
jgi:predicted kinase